MCDQEKISPYNIKQTSDENTEKYFNEGQELIMGSCWGIISWSNTKFSKLLQELYGRQ